VGLALFAAQRWGEAEAQLRGLVRKAQGSEIAPLVELWRGQALGMMGKLDETLRVFAHVQAQHSDPSIIDEVAVACGLLCSSLKAEARWLEAGRCAKFLFENLKTPLIETSHMFGMYGGRLHEAALYEEEYQAVVKLAAAVAARGDEQQILGNRFRLIATSILCGHVDEARRLQQELEEQARTKSDSNLELRVLASRVELDLALGKYQQALERLAPLAGSKEEEAEVGGARWGLTLADMRAAALILLGRVDEALEDLDAGRLSADLIDLRFILAAELLRRGRQPAAAGCLAQQAESVTFPRTITLVEKAGACIRNEMPVETFREFVDTQLQPYLQPLGLFVCGLALWANGEEQAALLPWSDAKNSAPDTDAAWHWTSLYLGRAGK
jgi:tetratricopeptide (TPR) repeat protein